MEGHGGWREPSGEGVGAGSKRDKPAAGVPRTQALVVCVPTLVPEATSVVCPPPSLGVLICGARHLAWQ